MLRMGTPYAPDNHTWPRTIPHLPADVTERLSEVRVRPGGAIGCLRLQTP